MPFYDNFSQNKPSNFGVKIADREAHNIFEKIITHKKDSSSVFEIGPGRGPFMSRVQKEKMDYVCVDISWTMLQDLPDTKRIHAMVPPLPVADNTFDIVFASNVLEHMLDFNNALALVQEMTRVAKPEGLICHRVPNLMAWGSHFWNGDYTHSFPTTPRNVAQLYTDIGLKIENIYPIAGPVIGPWAHWIGIIGKIIPSWITDHGAHLNSRFNKTTYSLKTTFLKGFLIVGRKA